MQGKKLALWVMALSALSVAVLALFFADRFIGEGNPLPARPDGQSATARGEPVIAAAGDIACEPGEKVTAVTCQMQATADLVSRREVDAVLLLGDLQYEDGALAKFQESFGESWGKIKANLYPTAGNHEYGTIGAKGYFEFFGSRAGEQGKGYYSFNLGSWHLIALNSNCGGAGGCGENSPQGTWLKQDLAAHPAQCTLAFWHHPRWSSGRVHGSSRIYDSFWRILYDARAELVLSGHEHNYERFAALNPDGARDQERGIRQFVVGTGGKSHYQLGLPHNTSEVRNSETFGVLFLTLKEGGYDWEFAPIAGQTFTDKGSGSCH